MGLDTVILAFLSGTFTIAMLSIILSPNGPTASVVSAVLDGFSRTVVAAKSIPGAA